jgi:hypothetical protein
MEWITKIIEFFKSHQVEAVIGFLYLALEYWLGKTDLVKPGSSLEAILLAVKKAFDFIKGIIGGKKV